LSFLTPSGVARFASTDWGNRLAVRSFEIG
jgi:hypothetical protein